MSKDKPLYLRLYGEPAYFELARAVGYAGCTYRELGAAMQAIADRIGISLHVVRAASADLVTYEGQFAGNPRPLTTVELRPEVRRLCTQLLGLPPELAAAFDAAPAGAQALQQPATSAAAHGDKPAPPQKRKATRGRPRSPKADAGSPGGTGDQ